MQSRGQSLQTLPLQRQILIGCSSNYPVLCTEGSKWGGSAQAGQQRNTKRQSAQHVGHTESQVQASFRAAGTRFRTP